MAGLTRAPEPPLLVIFRQRRVLSDLFHSVHAHNLDRLALSHPFTPHQTLYTPFCNGSWLRQRVRVCAASHASRRGLLHRQRWRLRVREQGLCGLLALTNKNRL